MHTAAAQLLQSRILRMVIILLAALVAAAATLFVIVLLVDFIATLFYGVETISNSPGGGAGVGLLALFLGTIVGSPVGLYVAAATSSRLDRLRRNEF